MDIKQPTLLLDQSKMEANLNKMLAKAENAQLQFRPHFKTHQSETIAHLFRKNNVKKIAVSSLAMAEYFFKAGWEDITVAFPCNILEKERIQDLASNIQLNLLVESVEVVRFLSQHITTAIGLFIKIDTGYGRTGLQIMQKDIIDQILDSIASSPNLKFRGFLAHFGHTYKVSGQEAVQEIFEAGNKQLALLKATYINDYPTLEISIGDTPTCSILDDFGIATEIRPGNFIFYDLMQHQIGSCKLDEIAVALACPIVAKHADRQELIIYGGGVHLSKDRITHPKTGTPYFGLAFPLSESGWDMSIEGAIVRSLSQEHGIVQASKAFFEKVSIGDCIAILPVHSCMTANLMKGYTTLGGKKIEMMPSL